MSWDVTTTGHISCQCQLIYMQMPVMLGLQLTNIAVHDFLYFGEIFWKILRHLSQFYYYYY